MVRYFCESKKTVKYDGDALQNTVSDNGGEDVCHVVWMFQLGKKLIYEIFVSC